MAHITYEQTDITGTTLSRAEYQREYRRMHPDRIKCTRIRAAATFLEKEGYKVFPPVPAHSKDDND